MKTVITYEEAMLGDIIAHTEQIGELAARLDALLAQQLRGFGKVAKLDACLDALAQKLLNTSSSAHSRIARLEKWIDGTDLITSERFCALAERVADLEASRTEHGKLILKLEDRVAELEHYRAMTDVELRIAAQERDSLRRGALVEWIRQGKAAGYNVDVTEDHE